MSSEANPKPTGDRVFVPLCTVNYFLPGGTFLLKLFTVGLYHSCCTLVYIVSHLCVCFFLFFFLDYALQPARYGTDKLPSEGTNATGSAVKDG